MDPIRQRLRDRTQDRHDRTEALFDRFDLNNRAGAAGFFLAHGTALEAVRHACIRNNDPLADTLSVMVAAIQMDLQSLERLEEFPEIPFSHEKWHSLGVTYVIAGSRLGAKVLARKAASARESEVRTADRYFTCPEADRLWDDFQQKSRCTKLDSAAILAAENIACAVFDCFETAARTILNRHIL